MIVPYLVQDPPPAKLRENRGSQGFASALRDHYNDAAADGERIMLLVVRRRAERDADHHDEPGARRVGARPRAASRPGAVAAGGRPRRSCACAAELRALAPRKLRDTLDADTVGRAAQAVGELAQLTTSEEVGAALHKLPWCLSDPELFEHAGAAFRARLSEACDHRAAQLEEWASDPSDRLRCRGAQRLQPGSGRDDRRRTHRLRSSTGQQFTLEDLLTGEPTASGR